MTHYLPHPEITFVLMIALCVLGIVFFLFSRQMEKVRRKKILLALMALFFLNLLLFFAGGIALRRSIEKHRESMRGSEFR